MSIKGEDIINEIMYLADQMTFSIMSLGVVIFAKVQKSLNILGNNCFRIFGEELPRCATCCAHLENLGVLSWEAHKHCDLHQKILL